MAPELFGQGRRVENKAMMTRPRSFNDRVVNVKAKGPDAASLCLSLANHRNRYPITASGAVGVGIPGDVYRHEMPPF